MSLERDAEACKILIIYTGGTIGMLLGEQGYQPEPFYLTSALRNQNRFHDPFGDSLFSNSSTVQEWRSHRGSAVPTVPGTPHEKSAPSDPLVPTLLVRSTRPVTLPGDTPASYKVSEGVYETYLPSLITPASSTDKRIRYAVLEWDPILDSSNIEASDWIRIATEIELNYQNFDAFIVCHGTDTICYTSSALSFLLEDLGKTVIITGAQIPLSQLRNDAVDNLLGSLSIAARYIIPECCLYFNHTLYRGNRVSKSSSFDLDAFSSPNFPALVDVGTDIVVNWRNILVPRNVQRFRTHKSMTAEVATLRLFPGITAASARIFFSPPIKGVILESFGAGNAPQRKDLIDVIKDACDRGIVIVTISQCARGSVSPDYATGRSLVNAGVVPGADMTPEAALTKLSYLLSKPELSIEQIRKLMGKPLRGELTPSVSQSDSVPSSLDIIQGVLSQLLRLSSDTAALPSLSTSQSLSKPAEPSEVAASWSLTASNVAATEIAILPYLMHLAAAKDDAEGVLFCIKAAENALTQTDSNNAARGRGASESLNQGIARVGAGIVNALDTSGRSPLHTAALHGNLSCTQLLLRSGASVHLRDVLDHTPLYYAARLARNDLVQALIEAGGSLAGSDVTSGYADLALRNAEDHDAKGLWARLLHSD